VVAYENKQHKIQLAEGVNIDKTLDNQDYKLSIGKGGKSNVIMESQGHLFPFKLLAEGKPIR